MDGEEVFHLETIYVTGEKARKSLKDTASSVAVLNDEDIAQKATSGSVADVLSGIPNVYVPSSTSAPIIRGVDGDGPLAGGEAYLAKPIPRVTINLDGRYVTSTELANGGGSTWDVEAVEVFRGPQTTTQGANAIAGAIVVNTKDPTFAREGAAQLVVGGNNRRRASVAVSGALSDDIAARFSMDYSSRDTYTNYVNPEFTEPWNDLDFSRLTTRMKLLWEPAGISGLSAKLTLSHSDSNQPWHERVNAPYKDLNSTSTTQDYSEIKSDGIVLDVEYEMDNGLTLSNQLQYSETQYDFTFVYPYTGTASRSTDSLTFESRLNFGDEASEWSGVFGLFYSDESANNLFANSFFGTPFGNADMDLDTKSKALFGEATWRAANGWSITGGARWQRDEVRVSGSSSYVVGAQDYRSTFTEFLPKLSVSYDINEDITVGGLVSKGYLPGASGVDLRGGAYYAFDSETAWNYEVFTRANLMNSNLLLNGNLFYTKYDDIQRSTSYCIDAACNRQGGMIINGEKAKSYGAEISVDYLASDSLRLSAGLGALKTEITSFTGNDGVKYEGKEFARAPSYSANLAAAWDIRPDLTLSGNIRYVDGYYSDDVNTPSAYVDGYPVTNLRLTYRPTDVHEFFVYANNVFDERGPLSISTGATQSADVLEPAELGLGVKIAF